MAASLSCDSFAGIAGLSPAGLGESCAGFCGTSGRGERGDWRGDLARSMPMAASSRASSSSMPTVGAPFAQPPFTDTLSGVTGLGAGDSFFFLCASFTNSCWRCCGTMPTAGPSCSLKCSSISSRVFLPVMLKMRSNSLTMAMLPSSVAMSMGVSPLRFLTCASAPAAARSSTVNSLPFFMAKWRAVQPVMSVTSGLRPGRLSSSRTLGASFSFAACSSHWPATLPRTFTTLLLSDSIATSRAVFCESPHLASISIGGSDSKFTSAFATSPLSQSAATKSGVRSFLSLILGLTPASSRACTTLALPRRAAWVKLL
mmetsp:Transcript_711/g.2529  ORF Transcript_711/g.2529 Transcript_711/m.2529 type:complete len:315 (+) Transcript_711:686-1630(+)